jgi:Tfp pilus assembly protein PilF
MSRRLGRHVVLAGLLMLGGLGGGAEAQLDRLAAVEDQAAERLLTMANLALEEDDLSAAEQAIREALRIRPQHRDVRFALGTLLIKQERDALAANVLERLLQDHPDWFAVMNNLAWLYATSSDLQVRDGARAVELAQSALLLQPNMYQVWNTLSEGHYVAGRYTRALRAAEEAKRLAMAAGAADRVEAYEAQIEKCRGAVQAAEALR